MIVPMTFEYAALISNWTYDMGLGMRPALCGKGEGYSFVISGIDFAQDRFNASEFRLTVAAFNSRAIRMYNKIGFRVSQEVTHGITERTFLVMITERII